MSQDFSLDLESTVRNLRQTLRTAASRVFGIQELLSTIFIFCLKDGEEGLNEPKSWILKFSRDSRYLRPSEKEAPLLFAHVCRSWRNVALDTPVLWTHLHLELSKELCNNTPCFEGKRSALKFWLSHSQSIQISMRLSISWKWGYPMNWIYEEKLDEIPTESSVVPTDMVKILFEHIHRWENIEILLPEATATLFYSNIDQQYPHLTSLRVTADCLPDENFFIGRAYSYTRHQT